MIHPRPIDHARDRERSRLSRRALLGAAAALAVPGSAAGQDAGAPTIRAGRWVEAEEVGVARAQAVDGAAPEPIAFATPYPVTAVAPHWSGKEPAGATIEVSLSADGAAWGRWMSVGEDPDGGRPGDGYRRFGPPILTAPASWVRYRTSDAKGQPAALRGMAWEYIDAAAGPTLAASAQEATPTPGDPFTVVSRIDWGADESLRFRDGWEIWPPEYAPVMHAVVHHSDTANDADPLAAIRSIYYYHAVTRGWGDIGYNLVVDRFGVVYEGRYGGENVVGGHALGYNDGTCGICLMGRFADEEPPTAMTDGLARTLAWVTNRAGLDPFGASDLKDIANLPTICGHRDVNPTSCPGDALYGDLSPVRESAAGLRDQADGQFSAFQSGGVETTADGVVLREGPGLAYPALATVAAAEPLAILAGPATADGHTWYRVSGSSLAGWVAADFLAPAAPGAIGGPSSAPLPADWPVGAVAAIIGGEANLRDAPAGAVVGAVPDGAWVEITGPPRTVGDGRWYPIDTGLGQTGWVSADLLGAI